MVGMTNRTSFKIKIKITSALGFNLILEASVSQVNELKARGICQPNSKEA